MSRTAAPNTRRWLTLNAMLPRQEMMLSLPFQFPLNLLLRLFLLPKLVIDSDLDALRWLLRNSRLSWSRAVSSLTYVHHILPRES